MSTSAPTRRPAGVTVIMVLTYLVGILYLVTGLVLLLLFSASAHAWFASKKY